jgi:hypothetical protein
MGNTVVVEGEGDNEGKEGEDSESNDG